MWTDISLSLACGKWYWVCGTTRSIWWYPSIKIWKAFSAQVLRGGSGCSNTKKRGCRNPARGAATLQRRREATASKMGVQEWSPMGFEYRYRIRYRTRYIMQYDYDDIVLQNWPTILDTISKLRISKFITYDIGNLQYSIPVIEVLYLRYWRFYTTIS